MTTQGQSLQQGGAFAQRTGAVMGGSGIGG
jgi:hypothetical protein